MIYISPKNAMELGAVEELFVEHIYVI